MSSSIMPALMHSRGLASLLNKSLAMLAVRCTTLHLFTIRFDVSAASCVRITHPWPASLHNLRLLARVAFCHYFSVNEACHRPAHHVLDEST